MAKLQSVLWSGLVLSLVLLLDATYRQAFHDSSAAFSVLLQKASCPFTDFVFKVIDVGSLLLVVVIPLYCYAMEGVRTGVPLLTAAMVSVGLNSLLKTTYNEERPYWEYGEVMPIKCTKGWGNPSGHSQSCAAVYGLFAYYAYTRNQKALMWSLLAGIAIVGLDRLYLGVHFYNQVALGWSLAALTIAVIVHLKLFKEKRLVGLLVSSYIFTFLCLVLIGLNYAIGNPEWERTWSYRLYLVTATQECDVEMNAEKVTLHALVQTPSICFLPGFLTGLFLSSRLLPKDRVHVTVYSWKNLAARVLLVLTILITGYFFIWLSRKINREAIEAILLGTISYFTGLLIAAVTPMFRPFPEIKPENAQPLVV